MLEALGVKNLTELLQSFLTALREQDDGSSKLQKSSVRELLDESVASVEDWHLAIRGWH